MHANRRKHFAFLSIALLAVLALAACGGGSSKANPLTGGATNKGTTAGGGSSDNGLAALVTEADKQKFEITFSSTGDSASTTYAQDGKGNSVFTSADSQVFTTSKGEISCDTSSGKPTCTEIPSLGAASNPFLSFLSVGTEYLDALGSHLGSTSSNTIAGQRAECITFSAKSLAGLAASAGGKSSGQYCFDKSSGVLLSVSGTDSAGKTSGFTVTKYGTPSASEFTPPATPSTVTLPAGVTIPSVPGGATIPGYPSPGSQ